MTELTTTIGICGIAWGAVWLLELLICRAADRIVAGRSEASGNPEAECESRPHLKRAST